MDKMVHNKTDVSQLLGWFERSYDMSSEDFYAAHVADAELGIPLFHRHVWASFWREFQRVGSSNREFVDRAEQTLAFV
jgi:hypothetical protein